MDTDEPDGDIVTPAPDDPPTKFRRPHGCVLVAFYALIIHPFLVFIWARFEVPEFHFVIGTLYFSSACLLIVWALSLLPRPSQWWLSFAAVGFVLGAFEVGGWAYNRGRVLYFGSIEEELVNCADAFLTRDTPWTEGSAPPGCSDVVLGASAREYNDGTVYVELITYASWLRYKGYIYMSQRSDAAEVDMLSEWGLGQKINENWYTFSGDGISSEDLADQSFTYFGRLYPDWDQRLWGTMNSGSEADE